MEKKHHVNLTQNPCSMCMPMGAMLALRGIEGCMTMLHGSQGCSTYIRRHMAGHFNEPVDIASSSLNEHGTIHGGANNLKKGLGNLIRLYNPKMIGVATTCLAETIGEDVVRILKEFETDAESQVPVLVPVQTPGYGGTQFEGWFAALRSVVAHLSTSPDEDQTSERAKTSGLPLVNIILPNLSPADVRQIKAMASRYPLRVHVLPDISETLDAPWKTEYNRIAEGGTSISDIREMQHASATIELCTTIPDNLSPGVWLQKNKDVPLYRLPVPMGLEATDLFLHTLSQLCVGGNLMKNPFADERGRLLDAMIDSHKHLGEGRACVYGEPEMVTALSRLLMENGLRPVISATGSANANFEGVQKSLSALYADLWLDEEPMHLLDTDFDNIRKACKEKQVNILIGSSEGKFITERDGIPLVRVGFPIHDRIGGQRILTTGYHGAMQLLDTIANSLLDQKYTSYRHRMHHAYYAPLGQTQEGEVQMTEKQDTPIKTIAEKTAEHPCYGEGACKNARMHLPVAPKCNISCNYCNRKFDCVNESRPGVTSEILTAQEAFEKFKTVREELPNLKVVGIAGPGDALANFDVVSETLRLIRTYDPEITFCLSTNGLMLPFYAESLAKLGVTHLTVTVNTLDAHLGARIYREINYLGKRLAGVEAAEVLMKNQLDGISHAVSLGMVVKVNTVFIKGLNEADIPNVVREVKARGAFLSNIMPLIPAPGSAFEHRPMTGNVELTKMRKSCEVDLKQMYHCRQCRADAIGQLSEDVSAKFRIRKPVVKTVADNVPEPIKESLFAVATKSGMMIDAHFGQVESFRIYRHDGRTPIYIETRPVEKYCKGAEDCDDGADRMQKIIDIISDCDAVVALRIGMHPSEILEKKGILPVMTCGSFDEGLAHAAKLLAEKQEKDQKPA